MNPDILRAVLEFLACTILLLAAMAVVLCLLGRGR